MSKNLWFGSSQSDPKRRFRFAVNIGVGNTAIPMWYIKTATKPKANVSMVEHSFLDHVFKYPGRVTWDNITLTLIDPIQPDLAARWMQTLLKSGYQYPTDPNKRKSMSKNKAQQALGKVSIQSLDAEGRARETWELNNAWVVSLDTGGSLDYTSDEMTEITVELAFDWATMTAAGDGKVPSER
jgi:hypothetical protein